MVWLCDHPHTPTGSPCLSRPREVRTPAQPLDKTVYFRLSLRSGPGFRGRPARQGRVSTHSAHGHRAMAKLGSDVRSPCRHTGAVDVGDGHPQAALLYLCYCIYTLVGIEGRWERRRGGLRAGQAQLLGRSSMPPPTSPAALPGSRCPKDNCGKTRRRQGRE